MNSVFSAFKSSTNKANNDNKITKFKKTNTQDPNSYEKLRHIREISYNSKMNNFVNGDDDDDYNDINTTTILNNNKKCPNLQVTTPVQSPICENNVDLDFLLPSNNTIINNNYNNDKNSTIINSTISSTTINNAIAITTDLPNDNCINSTTNSVITNGTTAPICVDVVDFVKPFEINNVNHNKLEHLNVLIKQESSASASSSSAGAAVVAILPASTSSLENKCNNVQLDTIDSKLNGINVTTFDDSENRITTAKTTATTLTNNTQRSKPPVTPLSSTTSSSTSTSSSSATEINFVNNYGSNRFHKPRLSLSNVGMPSVHGRSNGNIQSNVPQKTRLSTHQRNLSLDFR